MSFCSKDMLTHSPLVSIGMPVYNGGAKLTRAIDSMLGQSFSNFELIISDNNSTDSTADICQKYAIRDKRIRYVRQPVNIGAAPNFKFVLEQAKGRYYLWAAGDDVRSPDFLEENVRFLEAHPEYVASTSPNCFEGQEPTGKNLVTFALVGSIEERFLGFFKHCWSSHGIFYSVMRTEVLRDCEVIGQPFTAADWAIDLFLASHGNIHRTGKGLTVFGLDGVSSRVGSWGAFRNQRIEWLLPFYRLSRYVLKLSEKLPLIVRIRILKRLLVLNLKAAFDQSYSALYQLYCTYLRPRLRRANTGS